MPGSEYSRETKQEFFDLLDCGGTIRVAARVVGVQEQAAYRWVLVAGLAMPRRRPVLALRRRRPSSFDCSLNARTCLS